MTQMATTPRQEPQTSVTHAQLLQLAAADLQAVLVDLVTYGRFVRELFDTSHAPTGLVSEQSRQATDRLIRSERSTRVDATPRPPGLQWMRGTVGAVGSGQVNTAGNTAALSIDAELTFALQQARQRLIRTLTRAGLCPLFRLPADHSTGDLVTHLRGLVAVVVDFQPRDGLALVNSIRTDLEHVRDRAERLVDGDPNVPLPTPCVHCGRKSLVADSRTLTVRCDRTQRGNKPCQCKAPICECRRDPINHEHQWPKPAPGLGSNTWHQLISGINARDRASKQPSTSAPQQRTEEPNDHQVPLKRGGSQ